MHAQIGGTRKAMFLPLPLSLCHQQIKKKKHLSVKDICLKRQRKDRPLAGRHPCQQESLAPSARAGPFPAAPPPPSSPDCVLASRGPAWHSCRKHHG